MEEYGLLSFLNTYIFGPALPVVLIGAGIFLTLRTRFLLITNPAVIVRSLFEKSSDSERSPFRAAMMALAGTLGGRNISRVAAAISPGGAGSVFWMWITALCAMPLKYAEIVLALRFRDKKRGAVSIMLNGIRSPFLAALFALLLLLGSASIGNIVQINAAADSVRYFLSEFFASPDGASVALSGSASVSGVFSTALNLASAAVGGAFAVIVFVICCGGRKRVADFSALIIPVLSVGYILLSLAVIFSSLGRLPAVIREIFDSAFNFRSAAGGGIGFLITRILKDPGLRCGTSRGILSNEAGCGTATIAHSTVSEDAVPAKQGFWGIFEVFADTILLCSLTAFVILLFPESLVAGEGIPAALTAFKAGSDALAEGFGGVAVGFIAVSVVVYALASVVCWAYYGTEALACLTRAPYAKGIYIFLYSGLCIAGAAVTSEIVWELADLTISAMALLNTLCVCILSGEVRRLTLDYFGKSQVINKKTGKSGA